MSSGISASVWAFSAAYKHIDDKLRFINTVIFLLIPEHGRLWGVQEGALELAH